MKMLTLALPAAACAVLACTPLERSRALNDPAIPAQATAQQVCSNCHGIDGNSVSPNFPRLSGQPEAYLVAQLRGFRNQHRADPAGFEYMWGLSRHLSDAQIEGLAQYFSSQQTAPNPGPVDARAEAGQQVFEHGIPDNKVPPCASCHGAKGEGNGTFPRLARQHADYVVKQLMVFQRTDQRPEGAIMKTIAHQLTSDDMVNVARYVQTMQ